MQFLYTLFLTSFLSFYVNAQCENPVSQLDFQSNDVTARVLTGGDFWTSGFDAGYRYNSNFENFDLIFTAGVWMGSVTDGGQLKVAAQTYGRSNGNFDYRPGPVQSGVIDLNVCARWDRFFTVERTDVLQLQGDFLDGTIDNPIPNRLLAWPAVGNPFFFETTGFTLPETDGPLAPFFDQNQDGLYDPSRGDFPLFCGDMAIWYIFNDQGNHDDSGGAPLGVEVQVMAYRYLSDLAPSASAIYYDFTFINKSTSNLPNFRVGQFIDPDIGCFENDRLGSVPDNSLFYATNDRALENANCAGGLSSSGDAVPIQAFQILGTNIPPSVPNQPRLRFMTINPASSNFPSATRLPNTPIEYYNFLDGKWADGTPATRGGLGYNPGSTDSTDFVYDGNDVDGLPWLDCLNMPSGRDARMVYSLGIDHLSPGSIFTYSLAAITTVGLDFSDVVCPDLSDLLMSSSLIQDNWALCNSNLTSVNDPAVSTRTDGFTVFPNPAFDHVKFMPSETGSLLIKRIDIVDIHGRLSKSITVNAPEVNIARESFPPGMYLYRITDQHNRVHSGKFIWK